VTVREDEEYERAGEKAEEAAQTAEEGARAEAERLKQDVLTGSMNLEVVRQQGLIYGGLILIGLYMVQPFPTAPSLDVSAKVSILAFSVAIPLLAALVVVNRQEAFRGRLTPSVTVTVARVVSPRGQPSSGSSPGSGISRGSPGWRSSLPGSSRFGIHSAGDMRLEGTQEPTS
jgi:hypothetical protein